MILDDYILDMKTGLFENAVITQAGTAMKHIFNVEI